VLPAFPSWGLRRCIDRGIAFVPDERKCPKQGATLAKLGRPSFASGASPSLLNAHRALEVARNDPAVLADAAYALACFGEDIDAMIVLVDRALAFNPSYARGWHISGFLRLWAGHAERAIEHAGMALRLSPRAQAG
jgi:hypothetical protein